MVTTVLSEFSQFQSFPVDIVYQVLAYLSVVDLCICRLVDWAFHDLATPLALRNVKISLHPSDEGETYSAISKRVLSLHEVLPTLCKYATRVHIISTSTSCVRLDHKIHTTIIDAISQLRCLTSVSLTWTVLNHDAEDAREMVREWQNDFLSAARSAAQDDLEELSLFIKEVDLKPLPSIATKLRGLRSLTISSERYCPIAHSCAFRDYKKDCCRDLPFGGISKLISNNGSTLERLEINRKCGTHGLLLADVLPNTLTRLREAKFEGFCLPHTHEPTAIRRSVLENLRHLEIYSSISSFPIDALWVFLKTAGVKLESVTTYQATSALMTYLASYSGLRSLKIHRIQHVFEATLENTSNTLLNAVLPKHADTLEVFELELDNLTWVIPMWTVDSIERWANIKKLKTLKRLGLCAADGVKTKSPEALVQNHQMILDLVEGVENIQSVEVYWADVLYIVPGEEKDSKDNIRTWISACPEGRQFLADGLRPGRNGGIAPREFIALGGEFSRERTQVGDKEKWRYVQHKEEEERGFGPILMHIYHPLD